MNAIDEFQHNTIERDDFIDACESSVVLKDNKKIFNYYKSIKNNSQNVQHSFKVQHLIGLFNKYENKKEIREINALNVIIETLNDELEQQGGTGPAKTAFPYALIKKIYQDKPIIPSDDIIATSLKDYIAKYDQLVTRKKKSIADITDAYKSSLYGPALLK